MAEGLWQYSYLVTLGISILGNLWLDWRYRLVWWRDARSAGFAVGSGWAVFLVWDEVLLGAKIIWPGTSRYATGWWLWPGMPIEEVIFLGFLAYQTLVLWEGIGRWRKS